MALFPNISDFRLLTQMESQIQTLEIDNLSLSNCSCALYPSKRDDFILKIFSQNFGGQSCGLFGVCNGAPESAMPTPTVYALPDPPRACQLGLIVASLQHIQK